MAQQKETGCRAQEGRDSEGVEMKVTRRKARHYQMRDRFNSIQAAHEAKRPPEGDECPDCGADNWHIQTGYRGNREEPSEPASRECRECGNVQAEPEPDDDAAYEAWKDAQADSYFDIGPAK